MSRFGFQDHLPCAGQYNQWESEGGYCWFGPENRLASPKARTILQRATVTVRDLGTTRRQSRLAVTFISECSHINATNRTKTKSVLGQTAYLYNFGTQDPVPFQTIGNFSFAGLQDEINATFFVLGPKNYWNDYRVYAKRVLTSEFDSGGWVPADFLLSHLNSSSSVEEGGGPYALTLVGERLIMCVETRCLT